MTHDVVIIGGGPAGLNAALLLARARRRVVVVDGGSPRNAPATHLHGYLTRDGLEPSEFLRLGREEVARYGGEFLDDVAIRLRHDRAVELAGGRVLQTRRVLVTTGLIDELPDIPGVREGWGSTVLHCPYCHGWEVRDRPLGVIGGHEQSAHQASLIRQWSADLVFFPHTGSYDLEALACKGIRIVPGKVERVGADGVHLATGEFVAREAVYVAPAFRPRDRLLDQVGCARGADGLVTVDTNGRTSVGWVWSAGNTVDAFLQIIGAAAAGARAGAYLNADLLDPA
ncbi:NAD(P)/FAD-dependent oxidoreductase [Amycolatopsis sp. NPDC059657]|uniref:NAD(P)/FAD-dependent oxidoreductase n=1 Tax=Amycolatopsis sp. NPDC059657 TaxID=3346899 RepID=UPI00366DC088